MSASPASAASRPGGDRGDETLLLGLLFPPGPQLSLLRLQRLTRQCHQWPRTGHQRRDPRLQHRGRQRHPVPTSHNATPSPAATTVAPACRSAEHDAPRPHLSAHPRTDRGSCAWLADRPTSGAASAIDPWRFTVTDGQQRHRDSVAGAADPAPLFGGDLDPLLHHTQHIRAEVDVDPPQPERRRDGHRPVPSAIAGRRRRNRFTAPHPPRASTAVRRLAPRLWLVSARPCRAG